MAIMHNYCEDTRRKDRPLTHLSQLQDSKREYLARTDLIDPSEIATESVFQEHLFILIAKEVINFPAKQRQALLIDLANSMSFDECPTPLQKAFQKVGIRLQDYQLPLSDDPVERSRFSSNLHHAYNRIANLECVQQYIAA
jgi:hypothetical protein